MNFLAIDTSGKHLSVLAKKGRSVKKIYLPDCALKHSVILMDTIKEALSFLSLLPEECDFFAAVVGPGSFTGLRVGISTIKGLSFALHKPTLPVTSFDCIAYAVEGPVLALVGAGRGEYYAAGFNEEKEEILPPCILKPSDFPALPLAGEGFFEADLCEGLLRAVERKAGEGAFSPLTALYLRKPSAEEKNAERVDL